MSIVKSIRIQNFKSLEDVTIDLSQLTLLFGANSSGKSSFLKALMFLQKNIFPINWGKTIFRVSQGIDLIDYSNIVSRNDITRKIEFQITFRGSFDFPKFDTMYPKAYEENTNLHWMLHHDLTIKPFFEVFRSIMLDVSNPMESIIQNKDFLESQAFDFSVSVEFIYSESGRNLNSLKFTDNSKGSWIEIGNAVNGIKSYNFLKNDGLSKLFGNNMGLNNEPLIWRSINVQYGRGGESQESLLKDHIYWSLPSKGTVLSDNYNASYSFGFRSNPIYAEWDEMPEDKKLSIYYEIMKFIYCSQILIPRMCRYFLSFKHLPTTRDLPKEIYTFRNGELSVDEYYGFLSVLHYSIQSQSDSKELEPNASEKSAIEILIRLKEYLKMLGFDFDIELVYNKEVARIFLRNEIASWDLREASSGVIQILPILFAISTVSYAYAGGQEWLESFDPELIDWFGKIADSLETTNYSTILIEQPELHLHPFLQSKFGEIIAQRMNQLSEFEHSFIETHSEHLIRKLQVLIAKGELGPEKVGVWYFKKVNGVTKVEKMEIDENGLFKTDWPDGFFDDSIELTMELFEAVRKRKN